MGPFVQVLTAMHVVIFPCDKKSVLLLYAELLLYDNDFAFCFAQAIASPLQSMRTSEYAHCPIVATHYIHTSTDHKYHAECMFNEFTLHTIPAVTLLKNGSIVQCTSTGTCIDS
jgi:hypothetical protein